MKPPLGSGMKGNPIHRISKMKTFIFLTFLIGLFGISEPNERQKRFFGETFGHLLNGATSAFGSVIEKVFPGSEKLSNSKPAEILSSI
uniref:Uncharacterized protein n=1 Tax=Megaselia scalaris TaxID=36166 RepID=T1GE68_MEGSC